MMRDARFEELDRQIAAGLGDLPGRKIPANWQELDIDGVRVVVDEYTAEALAMPKRQLKTICPLAQAALEREGERVDASRQIMSLAAARYQQQKKREALGLWQRIPRAERIRQREAILRARMASGGRQRARIGTKSRGSVARAKG